MRLREFLLCQQIPSNRNVVTRVIANGNCELVSCQQYGGVCIQENGDESMTNDEPTRPHGKATSHDVAREAGVSRTTVSFVLNNTPTARISVETRERVLGAALKLGYVPDAAARMLRIGRTRTLGLHVRSSSVLGTDWFTAQLIERMTRASAMHDYRLLIQAADSHPEKNESVLLLRSGQIDGLIVLDPDYSNTDTRALINEPQPVVVIGVTPHRGVSSVRSDDRHAMRQVVEHLIASNRFHYAYLHYEPNRALDGRDRYRALELAVEDTGDARVSTRVAGFADFTSRSGYDAMQRILAESRPLPEAFIIGNDSVAIGALAALRQAGVRVPEDVAVTGFDDRPETAFLTPPLTTFHQPLDEMAEAAIEQAMALVSNSESGPHFFRGRGRLVTREST